MEFWEIVLMVLDFMFLAAAIGVCVAGRHNSNLYSLYRTDFLINLLLGIANTFLTISNYDNVAFFWFCLIFTGWLFGCSTYSFVKMLDVKDNNE